MKAKTFENLIRRIVREEIDYSLRREIKTLKEDLRDELKPTIVEHTERQVEVPEVTKNSLREKRFKSCSTAPSIAETNMPDPVAKVVNRDYRSLMQAIDKKKNR